MISLKCKKCGGEMYVDLKGELLCPYCRSTAYLSDKELKEYKEFRLNMLNYLRAEADNRADAGDAIYLWNNSEKIVFKTKDGRNVEIHYLYYAEEDNVKMYVARQSVIYCFSKTDKQKVEQMKNGIASIRYPSADIKNLSKYIPTIIMESELDNGGILIAISKPENVHPLFALGAIEPEHVAWIISRLENICCLLEFNDMAQRGISINSVFVNTRTHEAFLFGGWWNWNKKVKNETDDLRQIRKVADLIMGEYKKQSPKLFLDFITQVPADNAFEDFQKWDYVIEKGFGGHKFVKF